MFTSGMKGWLTQEQDRRRALRWLLVSIAIHLPFTPLGPLFGMLALLSRPVQPANPIEELHGIPIELLEQASVVEDSKSEVAQSLKQENAAEATVVPPTISKQKHPENRPADLDAGLAEDAVAQDNRVALIVDSGAIALIVDAGADASTAIAQVPATSPDEALAAATHGLADSNANIRLNLFMDRVREQPLAGMLGHLLKSVYQWRDFFAPGGLDPVRDFDHILVFGPQLRDSSQVAAFLQHNVRAPRVRGAIDNLVKNSGAGSAWLKGTKNPAARAVADRAQRLFVMYPSQVVAVVPPGAEKDALALPPFKLPVAKGEELASAFVKTPWRALLGTKFKLSKTIRSAKIQVYPEADGGARIEALLEDDSESLAQQDALQVKRDVDTVTLASNWLLSGSRFAEPMQVHIDDNKINMTLRVTRAQAERIFRLAEAVLTPEGRREARAALAGNSQDAGSQIPIRANSVPSATTP